MSASRIGQGIDVHPFCEGNIVTLGGIQIPCDSSLKGHSDADVLLHALCDAILGALGWGDIGVWFPDTDPSFKGKESSYFLTQIWDKATAEGWTLVNADCSILAEKPRINSHREAISSNISSLLKVAPHQINIKATTTEKLGFVGREEGIVAMAVVLISKN